jgi:putative inorganic carbon (HCO3(-)) transporter
MPDASTSESRALLSRIALFCAAGSTAAVLFSIAASQILLGMAIAALLASRTRVRLPAVWLPIALFLLGTLLSLVFSGSPATGFPQVKKIYVYLTLVVVYTAVRQVWQARALVLAWVAVACAAATFGLVQFLGKARAAHEAGQTFYDHYVAGRITGFMSHWQTFGGEEMVVLVMFGAFLMFSPAARRRALWLAPIAAILLVMAILLDYTRGVWLATACAGVYLIWVWKRRLLVAVPVFIALVLWINPGAVRERFESGFTPHGVTDSNEFRIVCWRTGLRMIRAHPLLGLGPEIVHRDFMQWVPADIPRPLPPGWYGHLHSIYLHYAAERGIPTALALVAGLLMMLRDFGRALHRLGPGRDDRRFLLHGAIAVVIAVMVAGVFEVNLGDSEVLTIFLAVAALGYLACEEPASV